LITLIYQAARKAETSVNFVSDWLYVYAKPNCFHCKHVRQVHTYFQAIVWKKWDGCLFQNSMIVFLKTIIFFYIRWVFSKGVESHEW